MTLKPPTLGATKLTPPGAMPVMPFFELPRKMSSSVMSVTPGMDELGVALIASVRPFTEATVSTTAPPKSKSSEDFFQKLALPRPWDADCCTSAFGIGSVEGFLLGRNVVFGRLKGFGVGLVGVPRRVEFGRALVVHRHDVGVVFVSRPLVHGIHRVGLRGCERGLRLRVVSRAVSRLVLDVERSFCAVWIVFCCCQDVVRGA